MTMRIGNTELPQITTEMGIPKNQIPSFRGNDYERTPESDKFEKKKDNTVRNVIIGTGAALALGVLADYAFAHGKHVKKLLGIAEKDAKKPGEGSKPKPEEPPKPQEAPKPNESPKPDNVPNPAEPPKPEVVPETKPEGSPAANESANPTDVPTPNEPPKPENVPNSAEPSKPEVVLETKPEVIVAEASVRAKTPVVSNLENLEFQDGCSVIMHDGNQFVISPENKIVSYTNKNGEELIDKYLNPVAQGDKDYKEFIDKMLKDRIDKQKEDARRVGQEALEYVKSKCSGKTQIAINEQRSEALTELAKKFEDAEYVESWENLLKGKDVFKDVESKCTGNFTVKINEGRSRALSKTRGLYEDEMREASRKLKQRIEMEGANSFTHEEILNLLESPSTLDTGSIAKIIGAQPNDKALDYLELYLKKASSAHDAPTMVGYDIAELLQSCNYECFDKILRKVVAFGEKIDTNPEVAEEYGTMMCNLLEPIGSGIRAMSPLKYQKLIQVLAESKMPLNAGEIKCIAAQNRYLHIHRSPEEIKGLTSLFKNKVVGLDRNQLIDSIERIHGRVSPENVEVLKRLNEQELDAFLEQFMERTILNVKNGF